MSAIKTLMPSLRYLSDNPPRSASHNAETRNDHIGWDNCAFENPYEIFDDSEFADYATSAYVDVVAD